MATKLKVSLGVAICVLSVLGLMVSGKFRTAEAAQLSQKGSDKPGEESESTPEIARVKVIMPKPGGIGRHCTQPATVQSFEFVKMYTQVSGVLKNQDVDIKSRVKKGRVMAEIDAPELVKEQLQAAANVEKANAQVLQVAAHLDTVKAEIKTAELIVEQRKSEIIAAKSFLKFRTKQLARYKNLFEKNAIEGWLVDEEYDRYDSAFSRNEAAAVAVESAKADVISKNAKLIEAKADLTASQANVKVAQAILEKADVNVRYTKIVAPFDGVVTQRNFNNGDFIRDADRAGQPPVLVVNRMDLMRVIVQLPDKDAPFVREGDSAELRIPSLPSRVFSGKVSRYADSQDPASRTMRVEMDLPNFDEALRDGMFGEATVYIQASAAKAVSIPSSALRKQRLGDKRFVYVVRDQKVHRTSIIIGYDNLDQVEVLWGLTAKDVVVVESDAALAEGMRVQITAGP